MAPRLYALAWLGLGVGMGLRLYLFPPKGLEALGHLFFALVFLLVFRRGPQEAPRPLVHALGAYLVFEVLRVGEGWSGVGFWAPALYLLAAFAYRGGWALGHGLLWAGALGAASWAVDPEAWPLKVHFLLAQPVLLALTLLLARYRELSGQVRFWQEQALTDALTGLPNRRALEMALEREAARVERGAAPFCLVLLDLDDFKRVNDEKGHPEGDRLLRQVARYLEAHVRRGDLVGRWGGEEFALLLPETDLLQANRLAERLREGLRGLGVSASFGVAGYREGLSDVFLRADRALYRAKRLGKDRVARSTEEDQGSR